MRRLVAAYGHDIPSISEADLMLEQAKSLREEAEKMQREASRLESLARMAKRKAAA